MATNLGAYYTPEPDVVPLTNPKEATLVELLDPPAEGIYREQIPVRARLTSNGAALSNRGVSFGIGAARKAATTNDQGIAATTLTLLHTPGPTELRASFQETDELLGSVDTSAFLIKKQDTRLTLSPGSFSGPGGGSTPFVATLTDASSAGRVLLFQTVVFVVTGNGRTYATAAITDFKGQASLGPVPLPAFNAYTVRAFFGGSIPVGSGQNVVVENDRYNPSVSGPATLRLTRDSSVPSCVVTGFGEENGAKYVEMTIQDRGAGIASITPTANSSNVKIHTRGSDAITFTPGTTAPVIIRGTKLNQSKASRLELRVVDAAVPANSLVCDPVITTLEVGERGYSETQTFKNIPDEVDTVTVSNTKGDRNVVLIFVNGRPFIVYLKNGEETSINIGSALKKNDKNTIAMTAVGTPGSSVEVMIWDVSAPARPPDAAGSPPQRTGATCFSGSGDPGTSC
jgi:hypothetical protein